VNGENNGKIAR